MTDEAVNAQHQSWRRWLPHCDGARRRSGAQNQNKPDFNGIWGGGIAQLTPTTCKQKVDAFPQNVRAVPAGGAKGGQNGSPSSRTARSRTAGG